MSHVFKYKSVAEVTVDEAIRQIEPLANDPSQICRVEPMVLRGAGKSGLSKLIEVMGPCKEQDHTKEVSLPHNDDPEYPFGLDPIVLHHCLRGEYDFASFDPEYFHDTRSFNAANFNPDQARRLISTGHHDFMSWLTPETTSYRASCSEGDVLIFSCVAIHTFATKLTDDGTPADRLSVGHYKE